MTNHLCDVSKSVLCVIDLQNGTDSQYLENYKAGLRRLKHVEITIISSNATVFEWLRNANQDQFEEVSSLLK